MLTKAGPGYTSDAVFDLSTMQPYNLPYLHTKLSDYSQNLIFYLPRTSDMRQVARYSDSNKPVLVMHYCLEGASKVSGLRGRKAGTDHLNIGSLCILRRF